MLKPIQDILNKQLLRHKPTNEQFTTFLNALHNLLQSILPNESEEQTRTTFYNFYEMRSMLKILLTLRVPLTAQYIRQKMVVVQLKLSWKQSRQVTNPNFHLYKISIVKQCRNLYCTLCGNAFAIKISHLNILL